MLLWLYKFNIKHSVCIVSPAVAMPWFLAVADSFPASSGGQRWCEALGQWRDSRAAQHVPLRPLRGANEGTRCAAREPWHRWPLGLGEWAGNADPAIPQQNRVGWMLGRVMVRTTRVFRFPQRCKDYSTFWSFLVGPETPEVILSQPCLSSAMRSFLADTVLTNEWRSTLVDLKGNRKRS